MATYQYDDFRVRLTPRSDGDYDVHAATSDGGQHAGRFRVPLRADALATAVLALARSHSRAHRPAEDVGAPTRDVGGGDPPLRLEAQHLGGALADALLSGDIGRAYEDATARASAAGRGLRLSLSLADAPSLLNLPWEFLYRRPRFLASQRNSPVVRHLDTGSLAPPPTIETTVRMLGVIASPAGPAQLDVAAERQRVEQAVARVAAMGRVELEWLEPATPRSLRQALRDGSFHIVHYVGHGDFTADGEGVLFLEDGVDRHAVEVDSTALANLLSDQDRLRLVVLNSCEGARTTLADPYAGVATTLIQLGVPAVVAMQFEITDRAAIVFAEELYTNLIGRQDPIDAAVAEARKAIYIEVDKVEWATPVLFVRHPDVELFRFEVPAASLPPTLPPGEADDEPEPPEPPGGRPRRSDRRRRATAILAAAALLIAGTAVVLALAADRDGGGGTDETVPTGPQSIDEPRPRSGQLAVQIAELDGEIHVYAVDPDDPELVAAITDEPDVRDTQPVWDRRWNRLAFTRSAAETATGSQIWYVVPSDGEDQPGTRPTALIDTRPGQVFQRFPAWASDGALFYTAGDCAPGPGCEEVLRRASISASEEGDIFATEFTSADVLSVDRDIVAASGFADVRAVATDPADPSRVAVVDAAGLHLVDVGDGQQHVVESATLERASFTPDGVYLVVSSPTGFHVHDRDGNLLQDNPLAGLDPDGSWADSIGRRLEGMSVLSITPDDVDDSDFGALVDDTAEDQPPVFIEFDVDETALVTINDVHGSLEGTRLLGDVEAIAF